MKLIKKYGVRVGDVYESSSGSEVTVVDTTTYAFCDDVVVKHSDNAENGRQWRIDAWKLHCVRYSKKELDKTPTL